VISRDESKAEVWQMEGGGAAELLLLLLLLLTCVSGSDTVCVNDTDGNGSNTGCLGAFVVAIENSNSKLY
jgi:hypothetical protein